jgi:hypothetical protein
VTLADLTRDSVLKAVAEFDRIGREAFLKDAGFGRARAYYLDHGGRLYDSKAIAGYAHGVITGTPLGPQDFSGGDKTVAQRLQALGFMVLNVPNPDWTRDEIILACQLVERNRLCVVAPGVAATSHQAGWSSAGSPTTPTKSRQPLPAHRNLEHRCHPPDAILPANQIEPGLLWRLDAANRSVARYSCSRMRCRARLAQRVSRVGPIIAQ